MTEAASGLVNATEVARKHNHVTWTVDVSFISTLAAVSLYVSVALIFHQITRPRTGKNARSKEERKFSNVARYLCASIAVTSLVFHMLRLWNLAVQYHASFNASSAATIDSYKHICNGLQRAEVFTLIVGTATVYLFLWTRQRVFYINPSLSVFNNRTVKMISYVVLITWIVYFVPAAVAYCIVIRYHYIEPGGCMVVKGTLFFYKDIIISWVSVSAFMQIALLGLFVNPIMNRMTEVSQASRISGASMAVSQRRLYRRVRRAVILTSVCLITDVLSAVITIVIHSPNENNFILLYNINLLTNLLAVVGCFDNWRNMLWPWRIAKNFGKTTSSKNSSREITPGTMSHTRRGARVDVADEPKEADLEINSMTT